MRCTGNMQMRAAKLNLKVQVAKRLMGLQYIAYGICSIYNYSQLEPHFWQSTGYRYFGHFGIEF
jgi:hypothetical protein